jgi:DNA-directed RNA polymerase subunit RPC12/RpoP
MGLNLICPQCGQRMTLDLKTSRVQCQHCGYIRPDEISNLEDKEQAVKAHGTAPDVEITHRGEVHPAAQAAFDTGVECLHDGDRQGALQNFMRALEYQPDFTDAHLWIAKVSDDPQVKRDHLESILVQDPTHLEALRLKMVLDGRLTPEQAAKTYHDNDPQVRQAGTVAAKATELLCPTCGGQLTVNEQARRVECRFCGYSAPHSESAEPGAGDLLTMALLERKAQPVKWNVGKRLVKCQQCGAEHTIPADWMAQRCRFCGSMEVILSDALASFEQPDGLIPFRITSEQAMQAINGQLGSLGQRIMGFFDTNKVERSVIDGVYLPFWVFDAIVDVTETSTVNFISNSTTTQDAMMDIAVCAVKSPPPALTGRLVPYAMAEVIPYEPRWLAKYPAQLYCIDFDAASLDARAVVSKFMRDKYKAIADSRMQASRRSSQYNEPAEFVTITSQFRSMSFRLLLLPVWIALLTEVDGDLRIGLVNGQMGRVTLGKSHKPPDRGRQEQH